MKRLAEINLIQTILGAILLLIGIIFDNDAINFIAIGVTIASMVGSIL